MEMVHNAQKMWREPLNCYTLSGFYTTWKHSMTQTFFPSVLSYCCDMLQNMTFHSSSMALGAETLSILDSYTEVLDKSGLNACTRSMQSMGTSLLKAANFMLVANEDIYPSSKMHVDF